MTSPQPVVPLLNYGRAESPPRDRWMLLFFLLSLAGWPVLFLNYTFQTSPWEIASKLPELFDELRRHADSWIIYNAATSYFLAIPVSLFALRLMIGRGPTIPERWVALLIALSGILGIATTLALASDELWHSSNPGRLEWAATAVAILVVLAMAFRNYRRRLNPNIQALICLYLSFFPNSTLCIMGFWGEGEIGYYAAAAVTAVYAIHTLRLSFLRWA